MSFARIALVTLALSAAPTIAAHAQSFSSELGSGNLVMIDSAGQLKTMQLTEAGMTMVMKGAKKLPVGTLIVRSGSSFYAIKDKRMGDGRMMSSVLTDPAKGYIR